MVRSWPFLFACLDKVFAKLKKSKKSKEVGGSRSHSQKKLENRPK